MIEKILKIIIISLAGVFVLSALLLECLPNSDESSKLMIVAFIMVLLTIWRIIHHSNNIKCDKRKLDRFFYFSGSVFFGVGLVVVGVQSYDFIFEGGDDYMTLFMLGFLFLCVAGSLALSVASLINSLR